jgi:alcohol dehydrogenase (cytochrome c)
MPRPTVIEALTSAVLGPWTAARPARASLVTACLASAALASCGATRPPPTVDWPSWGGTSQNTRFATLTQVDAANVNRLTLAWSRSEGPNQFAWETFPVVVGRVMYYSTDTDGVVAVDAATGHLLWSYQPLVDFLAGPQGASAVPVSRGVTVAGGDVYELTFDDQLIALDASTGSRLWDVRIANPEAGYNETSPGTYWNGEIVLGGPAGDAGLRGFVAAYDAATGRQLWRTYVVPARGHGWMPATGAHGGGDVWLPPTIDPRSGTVYAATGDPTPAFSGRGRPGCDPWSDATIALDARTGALEWGHTEVCGDSWDYDTDQSPVLFDVRTDGRLLSVVGDGSKAGFYSTLDAGTGALIARSPYITRYSHPHPAPNARGVVVCPGTFGGLEYGPPAYSPRTGEMYLSGSDMCMRYTAAARATIEHHRPGEPDLAGTVEQVGPATGVLAAIEPAGGRLAWSTPLPRPAVGGALATGGGLVFTGDNDGYLYAFAAHSGAIVWRRRLGLRFGSAPIAYEIDGVEYIAVAAGGSQLEARHEAPGGGRLFVFRLAGAP